MPVQSQGLVFVLPLVEGFTAAEVGVQRTALRTAVAIAAAIAATYLVVPSAVLEVRPAADSAVAVGAAFECHVSTRVGGWVGDDVDGTDERGSAVDAASGTFEHLDAHDLTQVDGQIHHIMTCLRVTDVNAVE